MRLALGTVQFGQSYGVANKVGQVPAAEAKAILEYAALRGIGMLDTAIGYGDSKQRLGEIGIRDCDECTSGFRQTFGGLHKLYGVEPDMSMFGKALGNGYAITGTIGRREIMEAAQSTFISSTFGTERIGPTAALKTLEVMESIKSWELITQIGLGVTARWKALAEKHGLSIKTSGLPAISSFAVNSLKNIEYKTLVTQEMLAKGYLATNLLFICTEHSPEVIDRYFEALDPVFGLIRLCEDGKDVMPLLNGPGCHDGFRRLN